MTTRASRGSPDAEGRWLTQAAGEHRLFIPEGEHVETTASAIVYTTRATEPQNSAAPVMPKRRLPFCMGPPA